VFNLRKKETNKIQAKIDQLLVYFSAVLMFSIGKRPQDKATLVHRIKVFESWDKLNAKPSNLFWVFHFRMLPKIVQQPLELHLVFVELNQSYIHFTSNSVQASYWVV